MRIRTALAALFTVTMLGALAAPASANCGELGLPGKEPILIIHC